MRRANDLIGVAIVFIVTRPAAPRPRSKTIVLSARNAGWMLH
jgi:hypothetical protein